MIELSREEIKPLLESHIYELLEKDSYIIENLDPKNLKKYLCLKDNFI